MAQRKNLADEKNPGWVKAVGRFALSWAVVLADIAVRAISRTWVTICAWLPSLSRLTAIGFLLGGCVAGSLLVLERASLFVPARPEWSAVALAAAVAIGVWGIAAVLWMVTTTVAGAVATVLWRLTDIANRPVMVENPQPTIGKAPVSPNFAKPAYRDPGGLADEPSGEFVSWDDEKSYITEITKQMRQNGMGDDDIRDMISEYQKTRTET